MRIFRGFEGTGIINRPVVTTGSFDGVHLGHKTILNRLKMLAARHEGESVLITFDPHPRKVLYPDTAGRDLKLINSQEEKLLLLEKAGLDNVIIVNFTIAFSKITSEEFVRDYLAGVLKARVIVAGFNHHFGFNKEGDYRQLWSWQEKYNFEAEEIPEQEVQHESVSSTRIRKAISEGYIQRANAYLDHYYFIMGRAQKSSDLKINCIAPLVRLPVTDKSKLLPAEGIYAVTAACKTDTCKGIAVLAQDDKGDDLVLFALIGYDNYKDGDEVTLRFHKKLYGRTALNDSDFVQRINAAIKETGELIY